MVCNTNIFPSIDGTTEAPGDELSKHDQAACTTEWTFTCTVSSGHAEHGTLDADPALEGNAAVDAYGKN